MNRVSKEKRNNIVESYQGSGLNIMSFCKREDLPYQTVRRWIKKANHSEKCDQELIEITSNFKSLQNSHKIRQEDINLYHNKEVIVILNDGTQLKIFPDSDRLIAAWVLDKLQRLV